MTTDHSTLPDPDPCSLPIFPDFMFEVDGVSFIFTNGDYHKFCVYNPLDLYRRWKIRRMVDEYWRLDEGYCDCECECGNDEDEGDGDE